jgi:steroid delta-isomerase-like uncharacterized protein
MTCPNANVDLIRKAVNAFNTEPPEVCVSLLMPDFIMNLAGAPRQMHGREAWYRNMEVMKSAFPDVTAHIEDIFSSEDRVALRLTMRGTHTGEFVGISPSGRSVEYTSIELYRITDGLIAEEWICSDMVTLMQQIDGSSKT